MCGGSQGGDNVSKVPTILDKSPWDSKSITAILCVSQVILKKKTVLSIILKIHNSSLFPTQYNVERSKKKKNCLDGFNTVRGVGGEDGDVQG